MTLPASRRGMRPQNSQDSLISPFVTEPSRSRRYSSSVHSSRSGMAGSARLVRKITVPLTPKAQTLSKDAIYDQNALIQQYEALYNEVSALRSEVEPMRRAYIDLKDDLLFQNRCVNASDMEFAYYAPSLSSAIGNGTFSSAIEEFQFQSEENSEEVSTLRNEFSVPAVVRLSVEVEQSREELYAMRSELKEMQEEESRYREQIEVAKQRFPRDRLEKQLDHIKEVQVNIAKYEMRNKKLETLLAQLEKETEGIPEEERTALEEIETLSLELSDKRDIYVQKCNEMIEIRNQQLKEIEELSGQDTNFKPAEPSESRKNPRRVSLNSTPPTPSKPEPEQEQEPEPEQKPEELPEEDHVEEQVQEPELVMETEEAPVMLEIDGDEVAKLQAEFGLTNVHEEHEENNEDAFARIQEELGLSNVQEDPQEPAEETRQVHFKFEESAENEV